MSPKTATGRYRQETKASEENLRQRETLYRLFR